MALHFLAMACPAAALLQGGIYSGFRQETASYNKSVLQVIIYRAKSSSFPALAFFFAHCFNLKNIEFYRISPLQPCLSLVCPQRHSRAKEASGSRWIKLINRGNQKKGEGPDRTSLMIEMCCLARWHLSRHHAKQTSKHSFQPGEVPIGGLLSPKSGVYP